MTEDKAPDALNDTIAHDLTLDELERSSIPNKYLGSVIVDFSYSNSNYRTQFFRSSSNPGCLLLMSSKGNKDKKQFSEVERIVMGSIGIEKPVDYLSDSLPDSEILAKQIPLEQEPCAATVA